MSHIVSFKITGLAGRNEPLEVELNRDTNIFFGLNGSGKTSILKILHSAMDNKTDNLKSVPFESAVVKIYSLEKKGIIVRSIEKCDLQVFNKSKRNVKNKDISNESLLPDTSYFKEMNWISIPNTIEGGANARWAHKYLPTSRLQISEDDPYSSYLDSTMNNGMQLTENQLDTFFARAVENLWRRYSAKILGAARIAQEQGLASILKAVLSPINSKKKKIHTKLTTETAYERIKSFLNRQGSSTILGKYPDFEKLYLNNPTLQNIVQDIDKVEQDIKSAMSARDILQQLITQMFTANKNISFTDEYIKVISSSGESIGLASLSSGEKNMLRILVEVLLAEANSFIIDEPEISLHIDWQKNLIKSLRALNSDAQFIFATHSPEILADIPDDKIFRI